MNGLGMTRIFAALVCLALLPAWACTEAKAQEPAPEELAKRQRKLLEKMQVVRAWKLTEVLELDEKNGPKLLSTLAEYDKQIFAAHMELRKSERSLRRAFDKGASEAELEQGLERVIAARKRVDALRYEQLEKAGATLDARRRVKLYHFLPQFEKEMRHRLREGRRGRRGPGHEGRPDKGKRGKGKKGKGKRHRQGVID